MNFAHGIVLAVAGLSAAIIVFATAFGIRGIAKHALEGIARQPQASNQIRLAMLLAAAFIEGIALFCAVICFMIIAKIK